MLPNLMMIKNRSGRGCVRLLAPPYERCPKCGEMNSDVGGNLWRVVDERSVALECDICATRTPYRE